MKLLALVLFAAATAGVSFREVVLPAGDVARDRVAHLRAAGERRAGNAGGVDWCASQPGACGAWMSVPGVAAG